MRHARSCRSVAIAVLIHLHFAALAGAQAPPPLDPLESMWMRVGPFGLTPSIAVTDFGVDSNVFRTAEEPRQDFTATVAPRFDVRLHAGRLLLWAWNATGFTYYAESSDQRSMSCTSEVRADIDLGRLRPFAAGSIVETRDRLNAELDVRAPRLTRSVSGGVKFLIGSSTAFTLSGRVSDLEFEEGTTFEGVSLARNLNSRVEAVDAAFDVPLTPLTTFKLLASVQEDRFDHSPERDSDSIKILQGCNSIRWPGRSHSRMPPTSKAIGLADAIAAMFSQAERSRMSRGARAVAKEMSRGVHADRLERVLEMARSESTAR